jgi:hypothetical protein
MMTQFSAERVRHISEHMNRNLVVFVGYHFAKCKTKPCSFSCVTTLFVTVLLQSQIHRVVLLSSACEIIVTFPFMDQTE